MYSIIDYFNANKIKYSASSLTSLNSTYGPEKAFAKSVNFFESAGSPSGQWWQVSFSRTVVISSYIITYNADKYCSATKWNVSISNDNNTFDVVKVQTTSTISGNTNPFSLDQPVSCKHFRLTLIEKNCATNYFFFRGFDCFGFVPRITQIRRRQRLISNFILNLIPLLISK